LGAEPFLHYLCPKYPGRPEFSYFLEEIVMGIEEKGKATGKIVDIQSTVNGRLYVGNAIGQRKSNFLNGAGAGFTDVVPANTDSIPAGQITTAVLKDIGR
jgi:hypothetical protein